MNQPWGASVSGRLELGGRFTIKYGYGAHYLSYLEQDEVQGLSSARWLTGHGPQASQTGIANVENFLQRMQRPGPSEMLTAIRKEKTKKKYPYSLLLTDVGFQQETTIRLRVPTLAAWSTAARDLGLTVLLIQLSILLNIHGSQLWAAQGMYVISALQSLGKKNASKNVSISFIIPSSHIPPQKRTKQTPLPFQ